MAKQKNKLAFQSMFLQNKKVERGIVDLLTQEDMRVSVFLPKEPGRLISELIGINSVNFEGPVKLWNGLYERGLWDPAIKNSLYLIDSENKRIVIVPNDINLFYDQDKVSDRNRYTWHGTFDEILREFEIAGYSLVCKGEAK